MSNKYSYIFLLSAFFSINFLTPVYSQLVCTSKIEDRYNESNEFHSSTCRDSNDLMKYFMDQSYTNSTRYENNNTIKSQLQDIFGVNRIPTRSSKTIYGFPEQRMFKDAHNVWESFKKVHRLQIRPVAKTSSDIPSGIDSSLLR